MPGDTFQFNQERDLVIIDAPAVGLVAVVPAGMSLVLVRTSTGLLRWQVP